MKGDRPHEAGREPSTQMRRLSVQYVAILVALVLLGVLLASLAAAAPPPPKLSVEVATRAPRQGSVVPLAVRSDRALRSLAVLRAGARVALDLTEGGKVGRGLLGIDMGARVGETVLRLEAVATDGAVAPVSYSLRVAPGRFPVQRLRVDPGYVDLGPALVERVKADQAAVAQVWAAAEGPRRWRGPFLKPVDAEPWDNFGVRRVFNGQPRAPHNGVDFGAPEGAPVVAPADARVAMSTDLYFSGGTIILDHGAGLHTTYFHLSRLDVAAGDVVRTGQVIGGVGSTGRSTGPHLHWGARLHGARVNPIDLLTLPDWLLETPEPPPALPAATEAPESPAPSPIAQ